MSIEVASEFQNTCEHVLFGEYLSYSQSLRQIAVIKDSSTFFYTLYLKLIYQLIFTVIYLKI